MANGMLCSPWRHLCPLWELTLHITGGTMEVTNQNPDETPLLTQGDLALAAYALSEVFNSYLEQYQEEDYGELSKEQMETSMNNLRTAFTKFDSLLKVMNDKGGNNESNETTN